ncbi:hypothetical protein BV22DRAFT_1031063 [Leucogyrophana mollusca]|uniref:Uncharacterized protein n=1 Tax=Leucogyrophana mollusca TaxID=85980 RepID=A0ACB8BRN4_9AGAM|nr:hypothetical protein BV22DRAFT_1031063 [Leucogyrophana mollusca]
MGGANYMGGKRNAAKARTRDKMGRLQRNHFGKQRLASVFAKKTDRDLGQQSFESILPEISFAHAQRHPRAGDVVGSLELGYSEVTGQIYAPRSPISTSTRRRGRPSKALTVLDTTEPLFMQAEIGRLLAIPDFAGLRDRGPRREQVTAKRPSEQEESSLSMSSDAVSEIQVWPSHCLRK